MNYAQIRKYDVANGEGVRSTLFVSGCNFKCKGCFNKEYQDFNFGNKWNRNIENIFISYIKNSNVRGASILGGEPLSQDNDLLNLVKRIKTETNKTIWLWTGFKIEDLNDFQKQIVNYVDVLVDGQFVESKKDLRLQFRGSSNQRIIDMPKSREQKKIVLWQSNN